MRRSENGCMEIEFPGRYVISEARFPAISEKIRNEEDNQDEPASAVE